jgi:hypothetical protein
VTPELDFAVEGVAPLAYSAVPTLAYQLRVTSRGPQDIRGVALDCQVRIDAVRRRYGDGEKERLRELFGEPARWAQTVRSLLWTHAHVNVPPFSGGALVELPVPCTYDFDVIAAKYLSGLEAGEVPLTLLFSGSVFYAAEDGLLRMARVPWSKETPCALPVATWRAAMDAHFPNTAWLRVRRDVFDRLVVYRSRTGALDWDDALDRLLAPAEEARPR